MRNDAAPGNPRRAIRDAVAEFPLWADAILYLVFGAALVIALWAASVGWHNTILDAHELRQSRTAMSVDYMLRDGTWLLYETPVFGPPWALPFELPVYQWMVALVVHGLRLPLEQAGRLVSEGCFLACLIPAYYLLGRLSVRGPHRLAFLSPILASPLYLFWSRTFMIESTALLLCLSFLALAAAYLDSGRAHHALLAAALGVLGAAVKITTFFGFLIAFCLLVPRACGRARSGTGGRGAIRVGRTLGLLVVTPLLLALIWTWYAQAQREQNPIAASFLTTNGELGAWAWGTLNDRLSARTWVPIAGRTSDVVGGCFVLPLALGGLVLARRRVVEASWSAMLFLAVVLAFPRLHRVHDYYAYENGLFLLAMVGWGVTGLVERGGWRTAAGVVLLLIALQQGLSTYVRGRLEVQRSNASGYLPLATFIRSTTAPDDVLLIYGQDWSPAIPYVAQRRALMDRSDRSLTSPIMLDAIARLDRAGLRIGAMLVCGNSRSDPPRAEDRARTLGLSTTAAWADWACDVYLGPGHSAVPK